jgi:heme A synthase
VTTILSGGFVAGNDAGCAYNTWPKMLDDWVPQEVIDTYRELMGLNTSSGSTAKSVSAASSAAAASAKSVTAVPADSELLSPDSKADTISDDNVNGSSITTSTDHIAIKSAEGGQLKPISEEGLVKDPNNLGKGKTIEDPHMDTKIIGKKAGFKFFEDTAVVQFNHRMLAYSSVTASLGVSMYAFKLRHQLAGSACRAATLYLPVAVSAQMCLGICTLLNCVPVEYGVAHQAGGVGVLSVLLVVLSKLRVP